MNAKVFGILVLLLIIWVFLGIYVPDAFLSGNNIENLLRRTALYGVLGIGVAFVIITSGIDLSIGSVVCLSGCLLAIFLHVDYQPYEGVTVLAVRAADKQLVVAAEGDPFKPGDHLRYYGGKRARSLSATVTQTAPTEFTVGNSTVHAIALTLDAAPTADDGAGLVARAYPVDGAHPAAGASAKSLTIAGARSSLRPRDQITLVRADGGLKQLRVNSATIEGDRTRTELSQDLEPLTGQWWAIPVKREQRMPAVAGVAAVLAIAVALGLTHGLLVTQLGLQPFVVTLCGLLLYRGITRQLVNDQPMGFSDEYANSLSALEGGKLPLGGEAFGIPYPFFILLFVAIVAAVFLNRTIWGRYMLALGRNEQAARYSGIATGQVTILAYVICTALAAVGGILFALDSNSVSPSSFGNFFELYAIAAAVLGGCSLRGGEGSIFGVVVGTALMQTLYNLIVLVKISDKLEFAIVGAVILAGVIADEVVKRYAARRRAARAAAAEHSTPAAV